MYDVGDDIRLSVTFAVSGTPTDPTTVKLYVRDPSGNEAEYVYADDITKDDTGDYHYDVSIDESGVWRYRWEGTGTAAGAEEGSFSVRTQQVNA